MGKILANRLVKVVDRLVSLKQYAFIRGRQILDGPFIINEIMYLLDVLNIPRLISFIL